MSRIGIFIAALLVAGSVCAQEFKSSMVEEKRAAILRGEYVTETGARTILHSWSIESGQVDDALDYLNKYTSTKNRMQTNTVTYTANDINSKRFAGTWVLVNVSWDLADVETGVGLLVRQLKRLVSADTLAELAAADNVVQENNEIVEPFNFKTGESDRKALVWVSLNPGSKSAVMALTDTQLVTQFASGWTYVDRHWKNEADGTASFSVGFQKVAWNAWTNTLTPDIEQWSSVSGDRTGVSYTWLSLQNSDKDTAVSDCVNGVGGVAADAGFFIADVTFANRGDGAFNITQTQEEHLSNSVVTATELLNPHSLCEGVLTRTTIKFTGFASTNDVPNPSGYVPGTDSGVVANELTGPDGRGMYGRHIVIENTSWATWASQDINSYDFISERNKGRNTHEITKVWCGIRSTDAKTGQTALYGAPFTDSGYVVVDAGFTDRGNGSVALTQVQMLVPTTNTSTSKRITKFGTTTAATLSNQETPITHEITFSDGRIVTTKGKSNSRGLWENTTETNNLSEASSSNIVAIGEFSETEVIRVRNAATLPDGTSTGAIVTKVVGAINEGGRFTYTKTKNTSTGTGSMTPANWTYTLYSRSVYKVPVFSSIIGLGPTRKKLDRYDYYRRGWLHTASFYETREAALTQVGTYAGNTAIVGFRIEELGPRLVMLDVITPTTSLLVGSEEVD